MKAWRSCTLAILSNFSCVEPAYQRCLQSGHCRLAEEIDSGIDAGPDIVTGLIGHWKLDETTPGKVVDSSGLGNHGQVEGVARFVPGKLGNAIDLEGKGGVLIKSNSQLSNLQLMSFAVWLNVREIPPVVDGGLPQPRIFDKMSMQLAVCGYSSCNQTLSYGNDSKEGFRQWTPGNGILPSPDAGALAENWRHFTVVHDRRRAENAPQFFLNGAPTRVEISDFVDGGTLRPDLNDPLTLGYRAANAARFFNGQLDDVRLYNRLLSAREVEALFRLAP
jgi:hypothetical protein